MNRRTASMLIGMAILGFAIAIPQVAFPQSDPFVGTWQLNLAQSKYSPGPPPKSQTVNVQAEGQGQRVTVTGVAASGNPFNYTLTAVFDGLPHLTENNPNQDAYAATRVNAYKSSATLRPVSWSEQRPSWCHLTARRRRLLQ
jgi:hypothetical protein